jgi:transposase
LRERWETGVHNARKLLDELRVRGYDGGYSQLKLAVTPWREEGRERAFVRFETGPGEQSQMDWGHFGNWGGRRLYGFALTLCYSRMRYIEFTQSQDIHHLLACMVHGFRYFAGVTESVLTDRMKTVLIDQTGGELHFNQKFLQFAAYYGFVPRVCRPYRPETKGKIESTVRFVKQNFWPGISFASLTDLNQQPAPGWRRSTTRRMPPQGKCPASDCPKNGCCCSTNFPITTQVTWKIAAWPKTACSAIAATVTRSRSASQARPCWCGNQ